MDTSKAKHWSKIIDHLDASSLTVQGFADENGIPMGRLMYWRRRLGRMRRRSKSKQAFVEVAIEEGNSAGEPQGTVVVSLTNAGAQIRVDAQTDLELIRRLVAVWC